MNLSILVLLPFLGAALPPLAERFRASRTLLALSAAKDEMPGRHRSRAESRVRDMSFFLSVAQRL